MKIISAYKSTMEEDSYLISCDRETVEFLESWAFTQFRKDVNGIETEPDLKKIDESLEQWRKLCEVLDE